MHCYIVPQFHLMNFHGQICAKCDKVLQNATTYCKMCQNVATRVYLTTVRIPEVRNTGSRNPGVRIPGREIPGLPADRGRLTPINRCPKRLVKYCGLVFQA